VHRIKFPGVYKTPPFEGDRMRTCAKMSSGPEPVRQHGSAGRQAKASGRLSPAAFPYDRAAGRNREVTLREGA